MFFRGQDLQPILVKMKGAAAFGWASDLSRNIE
jgi:hypothetical protein